MLMVAGIQSHADAEPEPDPDPSPEISVYESSPGQRIFLESGNTDGWISSDVTVDVIQ